MTTDSKVSAKHRIARLSVPEALAASLRERILNGEFQPGQALVQEALAAEYECSRMPVREAFRQLEAEGLIETRVHKGAVVSTLPTEQVMELFELRALVECHMLEHAIPCMTDADLEACALILHDLERVYADREMSRWGSLNAAFHARLLQPAEKPQSMAMLAGINLQVERFVRLQLTLTEEFETAAREHRELLELCRKRDKDAAVPFLRNHVLTAGTGLVAAIRSRRPVSVI